MSKAGIIVAVVAAAGLAAGGLYLVKAREAKQRAVEPVVFAAPDLFPAETVLFASIHDTEADWKDLEDLRAKVEPTAAWAALAGEHGPAAGPLGDLRKAWEEAGAAIEARLGRKPDAAEFFRVFGGDLAVGLAPLPKGAGLGALLVTRLPDDRELAALRDRMGGNKSMRQRQAPAPHGYPVWYEELAGGRTLHYGIGGGHLFLADDQALLDAAMGNLAALAAPAADPAADPAATPAPGAPRPPSLAADAVFKAGVTAPWKEVRMAMFLRKGAAVGTKIEQLSSGDEGSGDRIDALLARAFSAAPGRDSMAMAASGPSGARTWSASFGEFSLAGRAWEQRLPSGTCMAWIPRPVEPGVREKAFGAEFEAMKAKRLWKEIDALAKDGPRLQRLLAEMMGEGAVPDAALLAKIPADVALLGEGGEALLRAMIVGGDAPFCFAQKAYGTESLRTESVLALDLDPMTAVALAALADTAAAEAGEDGPITWKRTRAEGPPTWSLDLSGLYAGGGRPHDPPADLMRGMVEPWEPGLVLGEGTLYLTFGPSMREDVRALCAGKVAPLSADPLFLEAMAAAEPGATEVLFLRPSVIARVLVDSMVGPMKAVTEVEGYDPDGRAVVAALLGALDEAAAWAGGMRAQVTSTLADPERRSVTVTLLDPALAAAPPAVVMAAAPPKGPAAVTADAFLLLSSRMDMGPACEAFAASFLRHLDGGRPAWDRMLRSGPGMEPEDLEKPLGALLAGVRGEVGFAMASPTDPPAVQGPPSSAALAPRLPSLVFWADYADAGAAYAEASRLLGMLHEAVDEGTFEDDAAAFEAGEGPPAFGVFLEKGEDPAAPSTTLRMVGAWEPGGEYFVYRVGVLRRGDTLFLVASHRPPAAVAGFSGGAGSLADRIGASLPAGALPREAISLLVFREDGIADTLGALLDLVVPVGPSLTLQGLEEGPTPERMAAHEAGWREGVDLLKDAMRTGRWQVMATTREGDRWITVRRRMGGK